MTGATPLNLGPDEGDLLVQFVAFIVNAWNWKHFPRSLLIPQGVPRTIKRQAGLEPFENSDVWS